ncbi:Cobalt-zinc-cadmium resistance protein CzcA [Pontiella desulfatans]|uniref:Cobalt-zinc-cadmium resistance protein CzcA n=1 Tax=Pontiella desulfatans TaxID=2750659 RepID=A0A6C2TVB1_PONDE|nr:efflux RND transporter permease subunit [Pontiella desulfatans]VGO11558.1 Cobalt-zinc-cadmium resistance protein CzcA [Pontiella desulfatans]
MIVTNYAIKFRTAVFVFIAVLVWMGYKSYKTLPREGSPDITIPQVFVTAIHPGTAPEDMENLVCIPIEKRLNELGSVKDISAMAADSVVVFTIEYMAGVDVDTAIQRVKDKIDLARPDLPDDLDEPVVEGLNFSTDIPIMRFALSGDPDLERLKSTAEFLQDEIENISGVKEARIVGTREREIRLEFDLPRLVAYNIPLFDVVGLIGKENVTMSAGMLEVDENKVQVRVPGEFVLASDLRDLVVVQRENRPIYLRDIATVSDTYKDLESISRINGETAVTVEVFKRAGENSVHLIDEVKQHIDPTRISKDIHITIVQDDSKDIRDMLAELENNMASGFFLVIVVLLIFMGRRNSLFVGLAIPFSMLLSFTIMSLMGITMNMVVLFALILAVGMLVDNGIVIVENIYRLHCEGLSRMEAARQGAAEVAWPVTTSTLTTLAAFSPLLFWPDIMGEFMSYIPQTLIITLASSLFVALVINPAICSVLIKRGKRNFDDNRTEHHPFVRGYEALLRHALHHRATLLIISLLFLILSSQLYGRFGKGVSLFVNTEPRAAQIEVRYPEGTAIEKTDAVMKHVENAISDLDDIEFILATTGQGMGSGFSEGSGGTYLGSCYIKFVDEKERVGKTSELIQKFRDRIGRIPGVEIKIDAFEEGPPQQPPVNIEVSGENLEQLNDIATEIKRRISPVPGLVDLRSNYESALPELQFIVDRKRAGVLGLDTETIGFFLRTSIYGTESQRKFRAGEDEFDITVRLPRPSREQFNLLDEIYIPVQDAEPVPLSSLGKFEYTSGRGVIRRKNQKRVITISGNKDGRESNELLADIVPIVSSIKMPPGYTIVYTGDREDQEESSEFLSRAFMLALAGIVVVLVLQFNSVMLPFVILLSIILSIIGVMWGLLLTRMHFSIVMTGVGIISLAGIVVNNAIVLVDCINQMKAKGLDTREAVVHAGRLRLRPVLLTAVTTILGLIPMAIGFSFDVHTFRFSAGGATSAWWAPMAIAVIFGLAVSTLLTLVLVPLMYSLADSFAAFLRRHIVIGED